MLVVEVCLARRQTRLKGPPGGTCKSNYMARISTVRDKIWEQFVLHVVNRLSQCLVRGYLAYLEKLPA